MNVDTEVIPEVPVSTTEKVSTEEFRVKGDELVAKIKELVHEGNIRRIIVKNESGHTLIEIPLTVGVVGGVLSAAFFPVLAALGAIGSVVAHLTLVIEVRAKDQE
jgi:copper chaperone CopZ